MTSNPGEGWKVFADGEDSENVPLWRALAQFTAEDLDEGLKANAVVIGKAQSVAAFLAADLGIALEPRPDHASYIASWIKVLQNDTRAIVQAAAHAERAIAYLHQLAHPEEVKEAA